MRLIGVKAPEGMSTRFYIREKDKKSFFGGRSGLPTGVATAKIIINIYEINHACVAISAPHHQPTGTAWCRNAEMVRGIP